jgi:DNA-directed RNA polymerase subunit RPC12/RpoP
MSINYNVTGDRRKALVTAIGEVLALEGVYQGAPTFAYKIGGCTVDKTGILDFAEDVEESARALLVAALKERGFEAEASESADLGDDSNKLVIEIPREGFTDEAIDNLRKIIASKQTLIEKALGLDDLPFNDDCLAVEILEDKLCFPWFTLMGIGGEADAYARFICALCEMAKTQKRVTATEKPTENDKFTMRLFLVRLGLKGPENKAVRQIMLNNLSGNSSWKNGKPQQKQHKLKCLQCGYEFSGTIETDELGAHSSCPECGGSFDVDEDSAAEPTPDGENTQEV